MFFWYLFFYCHLIDIYPKFLLLFTLIFKNPPPLKYNSVQENIGVILINLLIHDIYFLRLLASLIQPVEILILGIPVDVTLPWVPDVKRMLFTTRKLCNDKEVIQAIFTEIMTVITDVSGYNVDFTLSHLDNDFYNCC